MATSTREEEDRTSKFAAVLKHGAHTQAPAPPPVRRRFRLPRWLVVTSLLVVILGLVAGSFKSKLLGGASSSTSVLTERVRKSDLVVSIAEDGNVESAHNVDIKCEVQGGATILWLIKDGTLVKKGDELVRLDSSLIEEKVSQQKIVYEKAKALMIEAEKTWKAADIAVSEYIEGTYVQSLQDLKAKATVAKENLETARNLLLFTNKMARQGYVTPLQRDAQAFAVQRATLDLQVAETAISVLEKFTKAKTLVGLESTRDSAEARMASEKAAFELEEDRLNKMKQQLEKCTVVAPDDGMVVYANEQSGRRQQQPGIAGRRGRDHARAADDDQVARSESHAGQNHRPRVQGRPIATRHAGQNPRPGQRISRRGDDAFESTGTLGLVFGHRQGIRRDREHRQRGAWPAARHDRRRGNPSFEFERRAERSGAIRRREEREVLLLGEHVHGSRKASRDFGDGRQLSH